MSIPDEVNFMSGRNDNRFNSTIKNNIGHWNNSPRGRNNSYHNSRNSSYSENNRSERNNSCCDSMHWNPRYNYSNNYDSRSRLNRYRHKPRDPKNKVRFEYNIADWDMMSNLRRMVQHLKEHPQANRNSFKKFLPGVTRRNQEEVREDTIAEMEIEKIQEILNEDLDLIFDALVIHDHIEEVDV